jgi:hypothetical protein
MRITTCDLIVPMYRIWFVYTVLKLEEKAMVTSVQLEIGHKKQQLKNPTTIALSLDTREKVRQWALVGENYDTAITRILAAAENCKAQHSNTSTASSSSLEGVQ